MQKKIIATHPDQITPPQHTLSAPEIIFCIYGQKVPHNFEVPLNSEIKSLLIKTLSELKNIQHDNLKLSGLATEFLETAITKVSYSILKELIALLTKEKKLTAASQIIHYLFTTEPEEPSYEAVS